MSLWLSHTRIRDLPWLGKWWWAESRAWGKIWLAFVYVRFVWMRGLIDWLLSRFMAASKVLGEETANGAGAGAAADGKEKGRQK